MPVNTPQLVLRRYHLLLYVAVFTMLSLFWPLASAESLAARAFVLAATTGYAALYTLPAWLLNLLLERLLPGRERAPNWRRNVLYAAAFAAGSLILLAIYADYRLYELYQYHFNGFVWNLLTTPGGIAALGATESTERTVAMQVAGIVLASVQAAVLQ